MPDLGLMRARYVVPVMVALSAGGALGGARMIEADLGERADDALAAASIRDVIVWFDGTEATLRGPARFAAAAQVAVRRLDGVSEVRYVSEAAAAPAPGEEPDPPTGETTPSADRELEDALRLAADGRVAFVPGDDELAPTSRAGIAAVAALLRDASGDRASLRVEITARADEADALGAAAAELEGARARAARRALLALGVPAGALVVAAPDPTAPGAGRDGAVAFRVVG